MKNIADNNAAGGKRMTKKEYKEIMQELSRESFTHEFSSITDSEVEKEVMQVVSLQDAFYILRKHVKKSRKPGRKIQIINIKG